MIQSAEKWRSGERKVLREVLPTPPTTDVLSDLDRPFIDRSASHEKMSAPHAVPSHLKPRLLGARAAFEGNSF